MKRISIAIDGPAGAGKSSVSKILAKKLGYAYLDTGAMYRAVTYEVLRQKISSLDEIKKLVTTLEMEVKPGSDGMHVVVNGEDVTAHLRTSEVSSHVSYVSSIKEVREALVKIQRKQAAKGGIVLDGRDIGTTVLPNADIKIFLIASVHTRALRRYKEMKETNSEISLEEIEKDIEKRDYMDSHREISPLKKADDTILLDNSDLTLDETAEKMMKLCEEKFTGFRNGGEL